MTTVSIPHYIHGGGDRVREENRLCLQADLMRSHLWDGVELKSILKNLSGPFLEIGCGVAAQTSDLLEFLPNHIAVIGLDINPRQIEKAIQNMEKHPKLIPRVSFKVQDATKLPYEDKSISGAYLCWVLEHMNHDNVLRTLSELKRVVKKGGIILINETDARPLKSVFLTQTQSNNFPPKTFEFFQAMLKVQEENKGNGAFGSRENMLRYMALAAFDNFTYKRLVIHFEKPDVRREALTIGTIELLASTLPHLIQSGYFKESNFDKVQQEIEDSPLFHWEGSQVLIRN